ncbi:MAG: BLUF domain-containing protein [Methyloligellaceae bacterium]
MYLFRLIYYSKNATLDPDDPHVRAELKAILNAAKRNNMANGITGALLFNQNYFAQVLEGDRKAVTQTFCRIAKDPRHSDHVILDARAIKRRRFADWSMCFVGQPMEQEVHRRYCCSNEFKPMKMTADSLLGFMAELIEAVPGAVHTNKPGTNTQDTAKRVFGERVLNRNRSKQASRQEDTLV